MSQEVTIMTLRTLFEKQVFVRLTEDHAAFVCTTKWPLLSKIRRVSVDGARRDSGPQVRQTGSIAREELLMLDGRAVEQGWAHQTAEFEKLHECRVHSEPEKRGLNILRWR